MLQPPIQIDIEDESDLPIEVSFYDPLLDLGAAYVPTVFPRFWIYLQSDGLRLQNRHFVTLMQAMIGELRMDDPRVERDKPYLRRMGVVFNARREVGEPELWDFRSLIFNLEQVALVWKARQEHVTSAWLAADQHGPKPFYMLPKTYAHQVVLPAEVAQDILDDKLYPVSKRWRERARQALTVSGG